LVYIKDFQFLSFYICFSEIYFKDLSTRKELPIRDVKASSIGRLISVRGIVMRSTEVKPMIVVATYSCDLCGGETYQPVCIELYVGFYFGTNF